MDDAKPPSHEPSAAASAAASNAAPDADLASARARIDALDAQILELLNRRATVADEVGAIKRAADPDAQVFRPEREAQVVARLASLNAGPLPDDAIGTIFREVMSACRALERRAVVAYLGPEGTYSEQAVILQFGRGVERRACASIDEIFRAVEAKAADFGVVPLENSTEGTVNRSLDLLLNSPLRICGEVALRDPSSPADEERRAGRRGRRRGRAGLCASAGARPVHELARSPPSDARARARREQRRRRDDGRRRSDDGRDRRRPRARALRARGRRDAHPGRRAQHDALRRDRFDRDEPVGPRPDVVRVLGREPGGRGARGDRAARAPSACR